MSKSVERVTRVFMQSISIVFRSDAVTGGLGASCSTRITTA